MANILAALARKNTCRPLPWPQIQRDNRNGRLQAVRQCPRRAEPVPGIQDRDDQLLDVNSSILWHEPM